MNKTVTSKKPNSLEVLRKLIREEVKTAIREEMVPILLEVIKNKPITENAPVATFTAKTPVVPPFVGTSHAGNSPSINILEETRREMLGKAGDLFTEKAEITITHKSSDELKEALRERIKFLMETQQNRPPSMAEKAMGQIVEVEVKEEKVQNNVQNDE